MSPRQLVCTAEHFRSLITHPMLGPALQLGRAVNSLRALTTAALPSPVLLPTARVRQSTNILLHLGATLYEALEVLDHLGPEIGRLPSFREHVIPLKRDAGLRTFKQTVLWPLRKTVVFHFDQDVLPRAFGKLQFEPTVFRSEELLTRSDAFYDLADFGLIPAAFETGAYTSFTANYQRFLHDTLVYSGYFCRAADAVLAEVSTLMGFVESVASEASPDDP